MLKPKTYHTPGPWHIGMRPGPMIYGPNGEQIADMRADMLTRDERTANQRLITEAPNLLAACLAALLLIRDPDAEPADANRVESLLAHAVARAGVERLEESDAAH